MISNASHRYQALAYRDMSFTEEEFEHYDADRLYVAEQLLQHQNYIRLLQFLSILVLQLRICLTSCLYTPLNLLVQYWQ